MSEKLRHVVLMVVLVLWITLGALYVEWEEQSVILPPFKGVNVNGSVGLKYWNKPKKQGKQGKRAAKDEEISDMATYLRRYLYLCFSGFIFSIFSCGSIGRKAHN